MSDLIKEFARQAGFKVNWQHEDVQAIKMAQYKEFAELIVRECMDICEDEDDGSIDTKSVRLAMIRIKKHFYGEKE
jgi:hypothetical protein